MRGTWSGLGLLLVVPWLTGCVSGPHVRLDTGQGSLLVYTPPADQSPSVEILQEEFLSSLTDLVLHLPLIVQAPGTEGRIRLASWDAGSRDMAPRLPPSPCAPSEPPDGCLVNGKYADCYAPSTDNPRSIRDTIARKVNEKQADRIVLNLDDSQVELGALKKRILEDPIADLKEVIAIKGDTIFIFYPFHP